jgi:mRNA-degrading endonuclease RelE of RelBE toxin-antitoxin system
MGKVQFNLPAEVVGYWGKLPKSVQNKVIKCLGLFSKNPRHPSLNVEPLSGKSKGYKSMRIDQAYRLIFSEASEMQIRLVFVGKHDDAYRYAERTIAPTTGGLPKVRAGADYSFLLPVPPSPEQTTRPKPEKGVSFKRLSTLMMPRTKKYHPLREFLSTQPETKASLSLSFAGIEQIINDRLPASARKYPAWWSNDSTHSQAWS